MAESVRQRRRELALRIALGAQRRRIVRQVLEEAMRLALVGILIAIIGAPLAWRWLAGKVPGVASPDVLVWLVTATLLATAVMIASVLPARRALSVNPLTVMRDS